ncbi:MAG: hypothetical protein V2A70_05940 [Candidatus Omnitrophota bacterium]
MKQFNYAARILLAGILAWTSIFPSVAQAQMVGALPVPGTLVKVSPVFKPVNLCGIYVYPDNPLKFDFLLDKGDAALSGIPLKDETTRLVKYFLTGLTIPESDFWVNLSPVERDRIMAEGFDQTMMGKVLLEQDYLLKQLAASMTYPQRAAGAEFWKRVYEKAYAQYGTTDIPVDALNKVWILPEKADVFVYPQGAVLVKSGLDVMMDADYARQDSSVVREGISADAGRNQLYMDVFKEVFIPELRREINEGAQFAALRQVYHAIVLATWYRKHLKDSFLGRMYVGRGKVEGVRTGEMKVKERIYEQYLQAFAQGVYNYIRDEEDPSGSSKEMIPRKYFSGGVTFTHFGDQAQSYREHTDYFLLRQIAAQINPFVASADLAVMVDQGSPLQFPDSRVLMADRPFFSGEDMAMGSGILKKKLLAFGLLAVLTFGNLGMGHEAAAAEFKTNAAGQFVAVVKGGDTLGGIVEQVRIKAKFLDQKEYKASALSKHLWAPDHLVRSVSDQKIIFPGQEIIFPDGIVPPTVIVDEVPADVSTAPALESSGEKTLADSPEGLDEKVLSEDLKPVGEVAPVQVKADERSSLKSISLAWEKIQERGREIRVAVKQASSRVSHELRAVVSDLGNKVSGWGPGIKDAPASDAAIEGLQESWGFTGLVTAILAAVTGLGLMRWRARPVASIRQQQEVSFSQEEPSVVFDDDPGEPLPGIEGVRVKGERQPSAPRSVLTVAEVKGVMTAGDPSDDKRQSAQDMFASLGIRVSTGQASPEASTRMNFGLKPQGKDFIRMDALGFLLGAGLGAFSVYNGTDPDVVAATMAGLPFLTRLAFLVQMWWHEVIGHLLPGSVIGAKIRDAFSMSNITVNWSLGDWGRALVPGLMPSKAPSVSFPKETFSDQQASQVRRFGFWSSVVASVSGVAVIAISGSYHLAAMLPLLGPWFSASVLALVYSRRSDMDPVAAQDNCKFGCGVFGVEYLAPSGDNEFYPDWLQEGMRNLMLNLIIRGGQEAGLATMGVKGDTQATAAGIVDGEMMPFIAKVMKAKRGGGELPMALDGEFRRLVAGLKKKGIDPAPFARFVDGHVRFATGGRVVLEAAHPFSSVEEKRRIWVFNESGAYVPTDINKFTIIQANGDNDYYNLHGARLSTPEIRDFFAELYQMPKTYFNGKRDDKGRKVMEALPPGDTPPVALQLLYHHTQGDWMGAAHFAFVEKVNLSMDEVMQTLMSYQERQLLGNFFEEVYARHVEKLVKLVPVHKGMSTRDLWISPQESGRNPALAQALDVLRRDLKEALLAKMREKTPLSQMLQRWPRSTPAVIDDFINTAVAKFFTGDRFQATHEFMHRAEGTYGLKVKVSTEYGVTLVSQGQGIAIGFSHRNKMMGFSSEHTTLLSMFGERGMLDGILVLDNEGKGQIADLHLDKDAKDPIEIKVYGMEQKRFLQAEELAGRMMLVGARNKYFAPLVSYPDPRFVTDNDIDQISSETLAANRSWDDPQSFNRQSSGELVRKLASRYVDQYIKKNSIYYGVARGILLSRLSAAIERCYGGTCSAQEVEKRRLVFIRYLQADGALVEYLHSRLDLLIGQAADIITGKLMGKMITEDDLFREKENCNHKCDRKNLKELHRSAKTVTL